MDSPGVVIDHTNRDRRAANRNIRAEARGVEEGHLCRWDASRRLFLVKSDSGHRDYELTVAAQVDPTPGADALLVVSCTPCPTSARQQPAGIMGCKHRTRVARRLERMGLARFDGARWRVSPQVVDLAAVVASCGECAKCGRWISPSEASAGFTLCEACDAGPGACAECGGDRIAYQPVKASRYSEPTATHCGRCAAAL